MNIIIAVLLSGFFAAAIGVVFGLPSLRIKGFYLAIATLAAQFFLVWLFEKWAWLYNFNASGAIQVPNVKMFGVWVAGAAGGLGHAVLCGAGDRDGADHRGDQPDAGQPGADLEGDAGYGYRGGVDRDQPAALKTDGVRRVVLYHRGVRRVVRVPVARRCRAEPCSTFR